jgi:hypothetical protein
VKKPTTSRRKTRRLTLNKITIRDLEPGRTSVKGGLLVQAATGWKACDPRTNK